MKLLEDLVFSSVPERSTGKVVELIAVLGGIRKLENPTLSSDLECTICSGKSHYSVSVCPQNDHRKVWICANGLCESNSVKDRSMTTYTPTPSARSILWPKFCEINGIGDVHHAVKFEDVKQADGKVAYMLKFAQAPRGIILMRGDPGTGKTFAAMAICELFTRKYSSCVFTTQKQMSNNWLISLGDHMNNYISQITSTPLLVVDDFATGEPNAKFLEFFMELINARLQWKSRGTVITTNLDVKNFSAFCGEALADRIITGQIFNFEGKSRREKVVL